MSPRLNRFVIDLLALAIPFVIGLAAAEWVMNRTEPVSSQTRPQVDRRLHPVAVDVELPTAVVLLDPSANDVSGVLASFGVLARSGEYNVFAVAAGRVLSPIGYGIDAEPHFAFGEIDSVGGGPPRIVVIPQSTSLADPETADWATDLITDSTWIVVGCNRVIELERNGAGDGVFDRDHVTDLAPVDGACGWLLQNSSQRIHEEGTLISTRGGASLIEGAFRALEATVGDSVANATAEGLHFRRPSSDAARQSTDQALADRIGRFLVAGFVWDKSNVSIGIFDGVDEVALGAALDLYPKVYDADISTVGRTRTVFRSKHGLTLVPRLGLDEEPKIHAILLPGEPPASALETFLQYAQDEEVPLQNPYGGRNSERFAYDATIDRIAAIRGRAAARAVAKTAYYHVDRLALQSAPDWPYDVVVVPMTFGLLLVFVFRLARKRRISTIHQSVSD